MRTLLLSALALGTLTAASLTSATAADDGRVLARLVAGTYLVEQGGSTAGDPRFVLLTLTENGAVFVVNSSQVGLNFSDEQGNWKRTGPLQITATTYNFEFGDPGDTTLREIVRVRYEINFEPRDEGETPGQEGFDPRLEDVSGVYVVEFFPPGFDVLDADRRPHRNVRGPTCSCDSR
jgi:hypothetical protein